MDSKKKARWPPSRYCTLCFEAVSRTSIPASSISRSKRSASNGIEGATFLTTSSMTEAPCGPTAALRARARAWMSGRPRSYTKAARPGHAPASARGVPTTCRASPPRHDVALVRFMRLDAGDLDRFPPQSDVGGDHRRERRGGVAERVNPERRKPLGECRVLGGVGHLLRDPLDGIRGHRRWRHQPVPRERPKARKSRLGEGGNVRKLRDALLARHRKQANGAAVCLRHRLRQRREINGT